MNELFTLIDKMLENRLSASDASRLKYILENEPEARRAYIEQCQLHGRLSMDPAATEVTHFEKPIDTEGEGYSRSQNKSLIQRFSSNLGIIAASTAISFVGVVSYLNLSSHKSGTDYLQSESSQLSPLETYEQAAFPESGNLKRPPTNFATISSQTGQQEQISFNRDIRPILSENCYLCHGPDANTREAELRLDIEAKAFVAHGEFDPAIVRGNPEESPLYKRITSLKKSDIMPPPDSHKSLTDPQKRLIYQWIKEGAKWEGHWAFIKPLKPEVPHVDWGNNEIDGFTYVAMRDKGLSPNQEADRPTLARRLSLDLIGLPPSPQLVDAFLKDTSANAYENLVDTLLSSKAYGEHQGRYWLDAARYADTHGLHLDNYREIWPYRDWVIQSFNDNKPFDAFTVEQIAGDLLPGSSLEQRLATGFSRCNPTTSEGGAIDEEYRAIYAKDRVETTATVFMGLTMGCAACHDHKFDPVSMKDFYSFSAFFNNFDGPIMDGNAYDTRPIVTIPKPNHKDDWDEVVKQRKELDETISKIKKNHNAEYKEWLANEDRQFTFNNLDSEVILEIKVATPKDKNPSPIDEPEVDQPRQVLETVMGDHVNLKESGFEFNPNRPFTISCKLKLPVEGPQKQFRIPVIQQFDGNSGWRLAVANSDPSFPNRYQIIFELIHSLKDNDLISIMTKSDRASPREFSSPTIIITYDGSGSVAGLSITSGARQPFNYSKVIDNLSGEVSSSARLEIGLFETGLIDESQEAKNYKTGYYDSSGDGSKSGYLTNIKFYERVVYPFELTTPTKKNLIKILSVPEERRRDRDNNQLEPYYFTQFVPEFREAKYKQAVNDMRFNHIYDQATVSLVMEEKDSTPSAFMLERGEYDKPGNKVFADIPESLGGLPQGAPRNRLGLAQWLVNPDNPLTARVTVNRFWQNLFGTGIVATSEDFGAMGENPTHPELLDWLAIRFQESGWNVKELIKTIVLSATYRQDSTVEPEELAIDRNNRYLARGARYRLDGEVLRDKALYISGSLNGKIGGPPVKPYQPVGIWNAVAYSDSNTAHFNQDHGEALYRRSLYTFWKRTAPPPNMVVFDVPSRENCNVRRERTNTPLQALTLMNDPQYVEAARKLAERAMIGYNDAAPDKISRMYTFAFGSSPAKKHQKVLERSYQKFYSSFAEKRGDAEQFVQVGDSEPQPGLHVVELASLTMVASQIMNLDSFVNKY